MSTPDSTHYPPVRREPLAAPCPPRSPFLLSLSAPATAASSNPNLKLKSLLTKPELAAAVRDELVPNGMTLLDMYDIVLWMIKDKTWRALGYAGVCKHHTLYTWLRLLAPDSGLPKSDDFTDTEIKGWYLRVIRAEDKFKKDIDSYKRKSESVRLPAASRDSWTTNLKMVTLHGNRVLDFNGDHIALGFKASAKSDSPLPKKSVASLTSDSDSDDGVTTPPTRQQPAPNTPLAAKENGNPQVDVSRRDVEAAKELAAAKERKYREAIDTVAMLTEQRHACDMTKMKALVDLTASEKVPPPCPLLPHTTHPHARLSGCSLLPVRSPARAPPTPVPSLPPLASHTPDTTCTPPCTKALGVKTRQLAAAEGAKLELGTRVAALEAEVAEMEAEIVKARAKAKHAAELRESSRETNRRVLAKRRAEKKEVGQEIAALRHRLDVQAIGRRSMDSLVREAVAIESAELAAKHASELKVHPRLKPIGRISQGMHIGCFAITPPRE